MKIIFVSVIKLKAQLSQKDNENKYTQKAKLNQYSFPFPLKKIFIFFCFFE